jgi:hypothetical protein
MSVLIEFIQKLLILAAMMVMPQDEPPMISTQQDISVPVVFSSCNTYHYRPPELTDSDLTELLIQYSWPIESMRHVIRGESGLISPVTNEYVYCFGSISPVNKDGSNDHCGVQINDRWWDFDFEKLRSSPEECIKAAWTVYERQGPQAWRNTWP